jgi:hypothetical protein
MANAKVKLGDTEATRIGLGTNRLTNSREHIAFRGPRNLACIDNAAV